MSVVLLTKSKVAPTLKPYICLKLLFTNELLCFQGNGKCSLNAASVCAVFYTNYLCKCGLFLKSSKDACTTMKIIRIFVKMALPNVYIKPMYTLNMRLKYENVESPLRNWQFCVNLVLNTYLMFAICDDTF